MNVALRFRPVLTLALLFGAFIFLFVGEGLAQSGAGSIQGTVKDMTGAVIDGAQVHVVNTETQVVTDAKSNHTGFYEVPELFTGNYKLTVTAPGMKTYETSIELLVSQNAVINPEMVAGAVTQTLEVNADSVQLTTNDSPAIESTLENERIMELPENSRDITNLMMLTTPGAVVTGVQQPLINGGDQGTLAYVIDGMVASNNNRGGGFQPNATLIDPDAIQEVRVETSNSTAQFATPATAVLSTKSGTNKIHGTFFETARNNAFGVDRNRDDPPNGQAKPEYIRNEFGLSAGGPVYIPKVYNGRDKTFWFFAYERYSLAQQVSARSSVPTVAMRNGDFSGFTTAKGVQQVIFDPATTVAANGPCAYLTQVNGKATSSTYCRQQFAYNGVLNTINPNRESPLGQVAFALYPLPNTNDNPAITGNLIATAPQLQITPKETVRVDQIFNQSNRMYVRYTQQANTVHTTAATYQSMAVTNPSLLPGLTIPAGAVLGYKNAPNYSYIAATGFTHVFSPTFFSETIVGGDWQDLVTTTGIALYTNYEKELNLPNNFGAVGFPAIKGLTFQNLTGSQAGNLHQTQRVFNLDENLTKILGRHQILFGGRVTHSDNVNQPAGTSDSSTYTKLPTAIYDPTSKTNYTGLTNTGVTEASLYLGSAGTYVVNLSPPRETYHQWLGALYVQDNFHVNSRLTLNFGLRYEAHPALQTDNGLMNSFDLKNDAMVLAGSIPNLIAKGYTTQAIITNDQNIGIKFETAQQAGMPANSLLNSYNWNFLPRIGFAYMLNENSSRSPVFRGGYGIYLYDTPQEDYANGPSGNNPFATTYTMDYSSAAQAIDGTVNELLRYNDPVQFGVAGLNTQNAVNTGSITSIIPGPATTLYSVDPNWKPVRVQQASATLEIPMTDRSAFRISYIGSSTTNLDVKYAYNNTPSVYQWEVAKGIIPPTGATANVATNPYDNTTYGPSSIITKQGFANFNSLQVNYQRLYHSGSAFQVDWVWAKAMRAGGDVGGAGSGTVFPNANFSGQNGSAGIVSLQANQAPLYVGPTPPAAPSGLPAYDTWHDMVRFQLYQVDPKVPEHYIKFNGLYDIPIGRGKRFLSHTPRWLNEIIGGYQLAGLGEIRSQAFQPGTGNYGPVAPLQVYKKSKPVHDCSSGVCYNNYLWFNGDVSPTFNPAISTTCATAGNCISGLPANFVAYQAPSHNVPTDPNFATDKVNVTLLNGTTTSLAYDGGPGTAATATASSTVPNYTSKTFLRGPYNWTAAASIFKVFPIRQGMFLRVNVDAFNVFNMPGENNPNVNTGIESFLTNYYTARQIQVTARFTF